MSQPQFRLKRSVLIFSAALFPTLAFGQSTEGVSDKNADDVIHKVVITGSSIKRIDGETALPVQVLTRADIERSGASTTEELVKQISALSSAGSSTTAANASGVGGGSIATISLRGLGSARTLVLVDGRRVSVYGGASAGTAGSSVDINSIPLAAIERVEVLKDGASSVYGSDAIAGVVNFILRKDYTGVEVSGTYGKPTAGSAGKEAKTSLFFGKGNMSDDGYNLTAGLSLSKIDPIMGADRPFASRLNVAAQNDLTSSITFPANVVAYGSGAVKSPTAPNCGPISEVSPYSPTRCSFDNSPFDSIQPESENASFMANGRLHLTGDTEAYFEAGLTQNKITSTTQPVPLAYNAITIASNPYVPQFQALMAQYPGTSKYKTGLGGFVLIPSSPYYPTAWAAANGMAGLPLQLNYRDEANGNRTTEDVSNNARLLIGIRGTYAGWDVDSGLLFNQSKVHEDLLAGYAQYSKVLPILNSGVINPFGATTDQSALQAVKNAEFRGTSYSTDTSTTSADIKGSREVYQLPAGAVSVALGGEFRRETFGYDPSAAIQTGDIAGLGGNAFPVTGQRNVESAYVEVAVPIVKTLDGDVAVRYDHYEGVGGTTNPKASLRWQPSSTWLFRSSVGTGFRAPSLTDLNTPQATSITANGTRDPIRCPNISTGSPGDCNFQFTTVTGGNPNLKPEQSMSLTFGIMFEPMRDLSVSLDAFRVNLKNAIVVGGLPYTFFMSSAALAQQYSSFIQRGTPDGNPSGVGPITGILQTNANLFKTQVAGVDVDAKYSLHLANASRMTFRLSGTYMSKYDVQGPTGVYTSSIDQALNVNGGVVVHWKSIAGVEYQYGNYDLSLTQNYQNGYTDALANHAPAGSVPPMVSAYQTFDAQLNYTGIKSTRLTLGLRNLTNQNPPYTNLDSNFLGGYDVSYGDPRGRFIYGAFTYSFK
jgi:iron complex outermembrane receptor protein